MDFYASPALLGGIVASVAMGGWTLGRWQSGTAPMTEARIASPVALHPPFEWRAADRSDTALAKAGEPFSQAGRSAELDFGLSLSELHAEVSAYRRQQQVFVAVARDGLRVDQATAAAPSGRGNAQWMGQLFPLPSGAASVAPRSGPLEAEQAVQPSLPASALVRV